MLESQTLWISPAEGSRDPMQGRGVTVRTVRSESVGRELGLIMAYPLRWWPWSVVATISAFEGPDRSAVFAGRRAGWFPGDWDVHEADGRLVGLVRGHHVLHAAGEILGRIVRKQNGLAGHILGNDGSRLTTWNQHAAGARIEFEANLDEQPLAKMSVIIAVLIGL